MSITKEKLIVRKEQIKKDVDILATQIEDGEIKIRQMKNNLNALAGANQQCDLFLKELEDDKEMPREKEAALNMATS
jgi:ABC-type sugar transport system ATPase subunit